MADEKKVSEKAVYLGKREEVEIVGQKFQVRGLTLGESLDFSDVVAKLLVKGISLGREEDLDLGKFGNVVTDSSGDIARLEDLLCKVTGKAKGFFHSQPPEFFAGILQKVVEMTNIKVVQENFTKMAEKIGIIKLLAPTTKAEGDGSPKSLGN